LCAFHAEPAPGVKHRRAALGIDTSTGAALEFRVASSDRRYSARFDTGRHTPVLELTF
jgi:hypothetical protein